MTDTEQPKNIDWLLHIFAEADAHLIVQAPKVFVEVKKVKCCPKCGGSGRISQFRHVSGGSCFRCRETGSVSV